MRHVFWLGLAVALSVVGASAQTPWRSELYPTDWAAPAATLPFTGKVLQDFSYAGYRRGEAPLPTITGPIFDVTTRGADPTGASDSTDAIQATIDAAEAVGGGVVYLPAGTYRLSKRGSQCLLIDRSNIVLRGAGASQTRLWNTTTNMRSSVVLRSRPSSTSETNSNLLTADLTGPTTIVPVANAGSYQVGQRVVLRWDFTTEWIADHQQQTFWTASAKPDSALYYREVVEVNAAAGWIRLDIPTRYALLRRDNARVAVQTGTLQGVGLEDFAIGNTHHPGSGFAEDDYNVEGTAGYEVHDAFFLHLELLRDSWVRGLASYSPAGNRDNIHLLSGGIRLLRCHRVTVRDSHFQRPQYGGGGGNGYMMRLQHSDECLVENFTAEFSRHGIMVSHAGTSGNVFLRCTDKETKRAIGAGPFYTTSGESSDHHMHFSHSNLYDNCVADNSYFAAAHRGTSGTVYHGLSAAHTVYWNTEGRGNRFPQSVRSKQGRYGYVIGTRGTVTNADVSLVSAQDQTTAPVDHVEGLAQGDFLQPASLYEDQRARRLGLFAVATAPGLVRFPQTSAALGLAVLRGGVAVASAPTIAWAVTTAPSGAIARLSDAAVYAPRLVVDRPGTYILTATVTEGGETATAEAIVTFGLPESETLTIVAEADSFIRGGASANLTHGTDTVLLLKNTNSADFLRDAVVRFSLAPLAGLTFRQLMFEGVSGSAHSGASLRWGPALNDAWDEATVTFNNAPGWGTPTATLAMPAEGQTLSLDVTALGRTELAGDGHLTLRFGLNSQVNSSDTPRLWAREVATEALRPRLRATLGTNDFAAWVAAFPEVAANQRGAEADPDRDQVPNLLEAVFGGSPQAPEGGPWLSPTVADGRLQLLLPVAIALPASVYWLIETSPTLTPPQWSPVADLTLTEVSRTATRRWLRIEFPEGAVAERTFVRLVAREI